MLRVLLHRHARVRLVIDQYPLPLLIKQQIHFAFHQSPVQDSRKRQLAIDLLRVASPGQQLGTNRTANHFDRPAFIFIIQTRQREELLDLLALFRHG